jgi:dTDP-4-amino-4,6-dideoxygalactose transaminase
MNNLPALLGNNPTFKAKIPLTKPVLPDFEILAEGLRPIFETGILTKGDHVDRLEEKIALELGVRHVVAVSSCTAGLMLTYRALNLSGDVIVPSFTFMATVSAMVWANLRPVFVDVDPDTGTLDARRVEAAITRDTSAIVAVHNFGNPADIQELQEVAARRGLRLIFDAAHGAGSRYQGSPLGAQGDAQVFSLSPSKLVVAGEGGIIATNHRLVADTLRIGREYGNCGNYDSTFAGLNARMPEFNALLARESLQGLESAVQKRNAAATAYQNGLSHLPGIGFQTVRPGNRSSYNMFSITVSAREFGLTRDELAATLAAENIDTRSYYDPPVHRQSAYKHFVGSDVELANTDVLSATSLCLPISSNVSMSVVEGVCQAIDLAYKFAPELRAKLAPSSLALV